MNKPHPSNNALEHDDFSTTKKQTDESSYSLSATLAQYRVEEISMKQARRLLRENEGERPPVPVAA